MSIDSYFVGVILIVTVTFLSVTGLLAVRRYIQLESLTKCHEVGGYLLSVVGTMYAVLLGLVVVDSMTKFQTARTVVEQEANSLADVFLLAESCGKPLGPKIQSLCDAYVTEVIEREWHLMGKGEISLKARKMVIELIRDVKGFEPVTENQKAVFPVMLQETLQIWDNRRARTDIARYGVPEVEWFVLILGGTVTVIFTYFFGVENLKAQILMTSLVSLLISLNLYLVVLFGTPFAGDLHVGADALHVDKIIFDNELGMTAPAVAAPHS